MAKQNTNSVCSGCQEANEHDKIAFNDNVTICESCIDAARDALASKDGVEPLEDTAPEGSMQAVIAEVAKLKKPKEIFEMMGENIIGQETARQMVASAIYQHQKRLILARHGMKDDVRKSNMFLVGSTGSGKTLLAETVAKICNLPISIEDVTPLTEAGYIGDSVEDILVSLLDKCDWDVAKAETGIVFLDEIDKITKRGDSAQLNRDPSGDGVQNALLKLVEGSNVRVPDGGGRKQQGGKTITIDTSKILFIASGAFSGIEDIIKDSMDGGDKDNFGLLGHQKTKEEEQAEELKLMFEVKSEHLIKYGMKPEFVGRFSTQVPLEGLSEEILKRIITEPKGSYWRSAKLLASAEGIELNITDEAVALIAKYAAKQKIGARAIDGALNTILKDFNFEPPSGDKFEVTAEMVTDVLKFDDEEK